MKKKVLQVKVIVGKGSDQFFVENDVTISPPSPPIFKIEEIDKKVIITDVDVIPGKVIFNAILWKNVIYKTVEDVCDGIVNGPLFHATFKVPFGGFVEMEPVGCEKVKECDTAELLEAFVEGEKDILHGETCVKGVTVFTKLLEKDVIKVAFKVVRTEHIPVICEDHDEDEKDEDECHREKCEKKREEKREKCEMRHDEKSEKRWDDRFEEEFEKKCEKKREEECEKKHEEKCEKDEDKWDKRHDCRGDFYARCRGSSPQRKEW